MNTYLLSLVLFYSAQYNVDFRLVIAVIQTESSWNVNAVGSKNEQGLFQLNPLVFNTYTIKQLKDPKINIEQGIKHLSYMKSNCPLTDDFEWVICYNRGVSGAKKVKTPNKDKYLQKIMKAVNNLNYKETLDVKYYNLWTSGPRNKSIEIRRKNNKRIRKDYRAYLSQ